MEAIIGFLGCEPEIRYNREGVAKTTLWFKEPSCPTCHHSEVIAKIITKGDLAENIALTLSKGMEIIAAGEFFYDEGEKIFNAVHVGPSLKGATADIQPNERRQA